MSHTTPDDIREVPRIPASNQPGNPFGSADVLKRMVDSEIDWQKRQLQHLQENPNRFALSAAHTTLDEIDEMNKATQHDGFGEPWFYSEREIRSIDGFVADNASPRNASRIVACVNALQGVPIGVVQRWARKLASPVNTMMQLTQQNEQLLKALDDARAVLANIEGHDQVKAHLEVVATSVRNSK